MPKWKRIQYQGWNNCYSIETSTIKMIVTGDVGPRIIFFGSPNGVNQFYVNPEESGCSGGNEWHLYGGHRFWAAPEDKIRTYVADNFLVTIETAAQTLRATAPIEPCGIQKTIQIEVFENSSNVVITHLLTNKGSAPFELAPWGLSVMRPGGTAIIPLPPKAAQTTLLTPTHSLALWGYTDITDLRWGWGDQFLFLRQDEHIEEPQKLGIHNPQGWAAYLNEGTLFIKNTNYSSTAIYPDFGSNYEFFTNQYFLEIESLSPLSVIKPGKSVRHEEYWSLSENIKTVLSDDDVKANILPIVQKARKEILKGM